MAYACNVSLTQYRACDQKIAGARITGSMNLLGCEVEGGQVTSRRMGAYSEERGRSEAIEKRMCIYIFGKVSMVTITRKRSWHYFFRQYMMGLDGNLRFHTTNVCRQRIRTCVINSHSLNSAPSRALAKRLRLQINTFNSLIFLSGLSNSANVIDVSWYSKLYVRAS